MSVSTPIGGAPAMPSPQPAGGGNADTKPPYSGLFNTGPSGMLSFREKNRKPPTTPLSGTAKPSTSTLDSKPSPAFGSTTENSTSNFLPATSGLFDGKSPAKNDNSLK
jgi:hypothetical protein